MVTDQTCQGLYGFATPFIPRAWLLGIGNIVLGLGTLATGWVGSFSGFLGTRAVASAGASAQHPVGSSLLVGYFPRKPGTVLALNTSISNIGSLLAPLVAAAMLLIMDWRHIFMVVASLSIAMGATYFLFRKRVEASPELGHSRRAKLARGKDSYLRVFRNRNMIIVSLVMMVGGAGRDMGVNLAYLGPIILGWLSDRVSRKGVIQVSLFLSFLTTLWLGFQGAFLPMLLLNLLLYGMVTRSRMSLTQAMVADSLPEADRDAAFSVFFFLGFASAPFWALLVGFLMEGMGFTFAFSVLALSYLLGMALMLLVQDTNKHPQVAATT